MIDLKSKLIKLAKAESEIATLRQELAMAFCESLLPDEVYTQVAASRAAHNRMRQAERLLDYYCQTK